MSDTKLIPCPNPWCSGTLAIRKLLWPENSFDVACSCGINSPACKTEESAIGVWNTRPALTPKQKAADVMFEALKAWERIVVELYPAGCNATEHKDEFRAVYRLYRQTKDALAKAGQP